MVHECFNCRSQFRKSLKLHRLIAAAAKYLMFKTSETPENNLNFTLFQHFLPRERTTLPRQKFWGEFGSKLQYPYFKSKLYIHTKLACFYSKQTC